MSKKKLLIISVSTIFVVCLIPLLLNQLKINKINDLIEQYNPPQAINSFSKQYDVIVVGGEPEGVAAAVSSARNGMNTLLIENRNELGGLMTYGMLNYLDIPKGIDNTVTSQGIFKEWHRLVGGESAFDITAAKAAFQKLVDQSPNLTLTVNTQVLESPHKDGTIHSITIQNEYGTFNIDGKRFIDATQDANFSVMSGAPYFLGGADIGEKDRKMAVTLMIHLKEVDWKGILQEKREDRFGPAFVDKRMGWLSTGAVPAVAWGFKELTTEYEPTEEHTRLRGLNIVRIKDDYYINALQIFNINGLSSEQKKLAIEKGKKEAQHILDFLKTNIKGFSNAEMATFPEELYVRETRHIKAEYQLPLSDVWENRDHWDSIGYGAYPVDVQAQSPNDYGYVLANPVQYAIPFRSLVPKKMNNLLVVGRSAGYSSLAAGSARVIPTGMVTGEAAGVAAAVSIENDTDFRTMSGTKELIHVVRGKLEDQGALVSHFDIEYPYEGTWYYPSIKLLLNHGLVSGGYDNDLYIEKDATKHMFANLLQNVIKKGNPNFYEDRIQQVTDLNAYIYNEENATLSEELALVMLGEALLNNEENLSWEALVDAGFLDASVIERVKGKRVLKNREVYYLAGELLRGLK